MTRLLVAAALGALLSAVVSLGLVSSQSPEDITDQSSVLTVYGER